MSPEEGGCMIGLNRGAVRCNGRYSSKLEDRMSWTLQRGNGGVVSIETPQNKVQGKNTCLFRDILVKDQVEVAADPIVDLFDTLSVLHLLEGYVGVGSDGGE